MVAGTMHAHLLIFDLDGQALNLLILLVASGNTSIFPLATAFLPPPQHLAFAATLAIHPTLTTRARSQTRVEEANLALRYLRLVLRTVGPVNANLHDAFIFTGLGKTSRRGVSGRRKAKSDSVSLIEDDLDSIENDLAGSGAIWSRADDIWQVVGWAFNCSILNKKRWIRWSLWLGFIIDVFQEDWEARGFEQRRDEALDGGESDPREKSMVVKSLISDGEIARKERKVVRAVFANGSVRDTGEFTEIWKNETKQRKNDAELKKIKTKIDIETDNYGDYMDEDKESDLEDSDPNISHTAATQPPDDSTSGTSPPNLGNALGGMDAINLRLRILSLLSSVSDSLPNTFTPLSTLYDIYLEHIRPLPLPTFFLLISPSSLRHFSAPAASSLTQFILRSLIAASAPLPFKDDLSQEVLEISYLPFAANTSSIADNAKVSICVETLLRMLDIYGGLSWSPGLHDAAEAGIAARDNKARKAGKKRSRDAIGNSIGDDERIWLKGSADRIRIVVKMTKS